MKTKAIKAISLLSGGLDSILATRLIMDQGIQLEALNFLTLFCTCTSRNSSCLASQSAAKKLGVKLKVVNVTKEFLKVLKSPKHGYGSNMNPCIDCRIFIFKKAKEYMKKTKASFIITGEVLGERPMSQRRPILNLIEKESGLKGFIVRPLSARLFKPSIPEQKKWVDRDRFLDIKGRSRKPQIQLASDLGINDYPCPAGGCLLTDPGFAKRLKDLMKYTELTVGNIQLLKVGRHFRLSEDVKAIIGRDQTENDKLLNMAKSEDAIFRAKDFPGPTTLLRGKFEKTEKALAARLTARYSDANGSPYVKIECWRHPDGDKEILNVRSIKEQDIKDLRV